jgi:NAD(P)-dependent dehydrogenase (short-subunit alcohol dehydrogenase family)
MKPPPGFTSLTAEWHNDTYPSISPSNPALSAKGKTVVVTGGGRGLGPEMGRAFAEAGAARVVLLGRTQSTLEKAKDAIAADFPGTEVSTHVADVADEEAVTKAAEAVGGWEVLVLNAGIAPTPAPIAETSIGEWWRGFEVGSSKRVPV